MIIAQESQEFSFHACIAHIHISNQRPVLVNEKTKMD